MTCCTLRFLFGTLIMLQGKYPCIQLSFLQFFKVLCLVMFVLAQAHTEWLKCPFLWKLRPAACPGLAQSFLLAAYAHNTQRKQPTWTSRLNARTSSSSYSQQLCFHLIKAPLKVNAIQEPFHKVVVCQLPMNLEEEEIKTCLPMYEGMWDLEFYGNCPYPIRSSCVSVLYVQRSAANAS